MRLKCREYKKAPRGGQAILSIVTGEWIEQERTRKHSLTAQKNNSEQKWKRVRNGTSVTSSILRNLSLSCAISVFSFSFSSEILD